MKWKKEEEVEGHIIYWIIKFFMVKLGNSAVKSLFQFCVVEEDFSKTFLFQQLGTKQIPK